MQFQLESYGRECFILQCPSPFLHENVAICNQTVFASFLEKPTGVLLRRSLFSFTQNTSLLSPVVFKWGGGFPHAKQFCATSWLSYSVTRFWHYPPSDANCKQVVVTWITHNFCPAWLRIGGSLDLLPLEFIYWLEQLTEPRGGLTVANVLKDIDEGLHGERSGRGVLSVRVWSLWSWGYIHGGVSPAQYAGVFTNPEALQTPYCWDL